MTGNSTLSRVIAVILTLALLLAALFGLSELVKRKASYIQYADFFDEKQNFDVLFFGTSHVLDAVQPMKLWKDYGFHARNPENGAMEEFVHAWGNIVKNEPRRAHKAPFVVHDLDALRRNGDDEQGRPRLPCGEPSGHNGLGAHRLLGGALAAGAS